METQLSILFVLGIFFILIGIAVLFLPEVKEKKTPQLYSSLNTTKKKVYYFQKIKSNNVVKGTILLLVLLLITSIFIPSLQTSSSASSSGTSSSGSSPSSLSSSSGSIPSSSTVSSGSSVTSSSIASFTVTFVTNIDEVIEPQTFNENNLIVQPSLTRTGFQLRGWFTSNDSGVTALLAWDFLNDRLTEDLTLYAFWDVLSFTISFESNDGSSVEAIDADFGSLIIEPTSPVKAGFTFAGWYNQALTERFEFTTMGAEDLTLYARWIENASVITFDTNGGNSLKTIVEEVGFNLNSLPVTQKEGFVFLGWYLESTFTTSVTFPMNLVDASYTLFAKWTVKIDRFTTSGSHHFVLDESGQLYGLGSNFKGTLGFGEVTMNLTVLTLIPTDFLQSGETIISAQGAGAGTSYPFSVLMTSLGRIFVAGVNNFGQLGLGDLVDRTTFTEMPLTFLNENEKVEQFSLGAQHGMMLTNEGRLFTWGRRGYALGIGDDGLFNDLATPALLEIPEFEEGETIKKIFGYTFTSIVITSTNRLFMWGSKNDGFGTGTASMVTPGRPELVNLPTLLENEYVEDFIDATFGVYQFVLRTNLGRFLVWGRNSNGELNNGNTNTSLSSLVLTIDDLNENEVISVVSNSASSMHVVTNQGRVFAWGRNVFGQLGLGNKDPFTTPQLVNFDHLVFFEGETIVDAVGAVDQNHLITSLGRLIVYGSRYTELPQFLD
jgi:uncharacterized repeat protein (TIGR02543 family)